MAEGQAYKRKSKKGRRRLIKKIIPMLVALFFITIIGVIVLATGVLEQFAYSNVIADYNEYFGFTSENEVAILMDDKFLQDRAIKQNGKIYIPSELVGNYLWNDFYYDERENKLLYTSEFSTEVYAEDDGVFFFEGDDMYLSADYVKKYANADIKIWSEPERIEIMYKSETIKVADVSRETKARVLGGIKSDVLTGLNAGDKVTVLDKMETWCKIKTPDSFIGYVENKCLDNFREETTQIAVAPNALNITHTIRDHKISLAWHQVTNMTANGLLMSALEKTKGLNVISPTWFSLCDNEGNISSIASEEYVKNAHAAGLEVWAVVDNFAEGVSSYEILSYSNKRQFLISNLMQAVLGAGIDGINIDFESLDSSCAGCFPQFIRELSIPCRENGIVLSVDNYVPKEFTEFYNRSAQGRYADYVIIMGYDEHYAGSTESGSVASFDFVREGIEKTIKDVPANQVINGIPFYTRTWEEGKVISSDAVGMNQAKEYVIKHGMELVWDDKCAQFYGESVENGVTYKIWLEDLQSIQIKIDLMKKHQIAGVACWKLGLQDNGVWDIIEAYVNN